MIESNLIDSKDPLLQPFQIKGVRFKNRIMSTSHACGLEEGGLPKAGYQAYHEEKAKGGLALSMFGGSSNIDRDSPNIFRQLNVGSDEIIPHLIDFSEKMHRHGAALMCQITHLGRRGDPYAGDWLTTIGPSPVRETLHRSIPKEMDEHDIKRVVEAYAKAAVRCKEGGLDGIETLAAGHLIGQFLSPITNRRSDKYGGSLENRCRFAIMVHESIRNAVGDDFIVGIRFSVDEGIKGGLGFEESLTAAKMLHEQAGLDFINAVYGSMDSVRALAEENMPGMGTPLAPWVKPIGIFKKEVGVPVFHAARIADISSARFAVSEGLVDMAGMTRAQIADPHLVAKLKNGTEEQIRPCVGATHCQSPYRPACLHNPATGRERTLQHSIRPTEGAYKKVIVIGGGPAGLEAARVSAERGHQVSLYEATQDLGGQVHIGSTGSWRRDLIGIIEWRQAELERLKVNMHFNRFMEAEDVLELDADVVIVATGGLPNIDILYGEELCVNTWDILNNQVPVGKEVLVYDGTGRHPAPLAAERAAAAGANLKYVSIDASLGEELTYVEKMRWKKMFIEKGVPFTPETRLIGVERNDSGLVAVLCNEITLNEQKVFVDQVIVEQGSVPMDELFKDLRKHSCNDGVVDLHSFAEALEQPAYDKQGFTLYRVGDSVSSRNIHTAILDSLRLCSSL